ncbi:MAG: GAF domain-containing protein, partial [Nitrospinae bacterium]|nr:GAF domain-containing protein [Nitrospinota bacterium]
MNLFRPYYLSAIFICALFLLVGSQSFAGDGRYVGMVADDVVLPFLAALAVLCVVGVLSSNWVLKKQVRARTRDLEAELSERQEAESKLQRTNILLNAIQHSQNRYIESSNSLETFNELLKRMLDITDSEYGFLGEVIYAPETGQPRLRIMTLTNISWDDESEALYKKHFHGVLEFCDMDTLYGEVITKRNHVISNDAKGDPRAGGLPPGHPPLKAFLGLPLFHGDDLIGMVGMANRPGGYNFSMLDYLKPFLGTCANMFHAFKNEMKRREAEEDLKKAVEEAEKANKAKSEFLSRMSHELRTPLTTVIEFTAIISDELSGPISDEQRKHLNIIKLNLDRLGNIISNLLNMSRIEAGYTETNQSVIVLKSFIDHIVKLMQPLAQTKSIRFITELPGNNSEFIADNDLLTQVL